jgi:DNA helicase-2/ATP-dependent DNA helicase PcrA
MSRAELDDMLGVTFTDEQWGCVSAPLEPFVIVAGAGTGKTSVMAARVLWLVASGLVAEHQVLGLTFTNKAAAELAARVRILLARFRDRRPADRDESSGEPTIATYHSFARRLIDEQGLRVGIEPGARLLSEAAVAQLAHRVVCDAEGLVVSRHAPSRLAGEVIRLDANLAEQTISTDELRTHDRAVIAAIDALPKTTKVIKEIGLTAARRIELADLVDRVRAERLRVGGLDFSDHMRLCVDLVRSSAELVDSMRAAFPVVLLDEYQDTSIAQRVILSTLFAGGAVTAVGDPLQAIYGWRSASVANIAAFGAHFGAGGVTSVRVLSVNRRSGDPILGAANRVAADLRGAHPEVAELRSPAPRTAEVRAALLPTIAAEREWIADQVAAQVAAGRAPEEIAVLARANDSLGPLRDAFEARGVAACISGAAAISASPYATAVLCTLRVLDDPADNAALVTLLAGSRWRIGPADLELLGRRADALAGGPATRRARWRDAASSPGTLRERLGEASARPDPVERPSLLEAAADPGPGISSEARERLAAFVAEIRHLQGQVGQPLAELTARVVTVTGAQVEADLRVARLGPLGPVDGDVGLAGLLHLVDGFSDAEGRSGLGAFLAYLDAAEQLGSGEQVDLPVVRGAVQLMTMHKAKGLEFPVVVLPHLAKDVFPGKVGSERWTTQAHVVPSELRDDRHVLPMLAGYASKEHAAYIEACRAHDRSGDDRLAYVAITRAEEVLIASGHWWGPSQKGMRGPSPYLEALREQAVASVRQVGAAAGGPVAGSVGSATHPTDDQLDLQLGLLRALPDTTPVGQPDAAGDPWAEQPVEDESGVAPSNPMLDLVEEVIWPVPDPGPDHPTVRAARAVAALMRSGASDPWESGGGAQVGPMADPLADPVPDADPDPVAQQVAEWDAAIMALLARSEQAAAEARIVRVPGVLSASATMDLAADPTSFAERLVRPMPRRRNRHADLGTAFHAWVEARLGVQPLIADDELPGAADAGIDSIEELAALKEAFEALPYAAREPAGLEVPFGLALGGRIIRGRIDAVFPAGPEAPDGQLWEVVDWKTSARDEADPLQLAIYRLAWADIAGVPVESVGAAFAFVRSGTVVRPPVLPGPEEVMQLITSGADPGPEG